MPFVRNGVKRDSLSVLLHFQEDVLPSRVKVGFLSYIVKKYAAPPIRCYKCQRYGHVAAICKGKQRCGKCEGEHQYGECSDKDKLKCCNCGGEHSAGYGGCEARKKAAEVQKVKVATGISYAEAIKRVKNYRI